MPTNGWRVSCWLSEASWSSHHHGVLAGVLDLALSGVAVAASCAAFRHTGSVLLAAWCFFLVQASFAGLPGRAAPGCRPSDNLARARATAAAALARLERGA